MIHRRRSTCGYFDQIVFVYLLIGLVLFLLAIIFGRHVGFETALTTGLCLWGIVAVVFISITGVNLLVVKLYKHFSKLKNDRNAWFEQD